MSRTEVELLEEISRKLDKLIGVLSIQGKDEETQTKILRSLGLTLKETSILLGIPEGTLKSRGHRKEKKSTLKDKKTEVSLFKSVSAQDSLSSL